MPTETLKLSDFKISGQPGQKISDCAEQMAVSGPEIRGYRWVLISTYRVSQALGKSR